MHLNKKYLLGKINKFLKQKHVIKFAKLKNACGYCESCCDYFIITIDPRKDLLPTALHEILHGLYSEASEGRIKMMEGYLVKHMTITQYHHFLFYLTSRMENIILV
jgi:hypothetical protein